MSDYEYEYQDKNGKHTRVVGSGSRVLLQFFSPEQAYSGIAQDARVIPAEDAPAVALAILEAAGVRPCITPREWADAREGAAYYLNEWVSDRAEEKARRAAEDGRIREWLEAVYPGSSCAAGCDEPISDKVRDRFRRSRDFFTDIPF